MEFLSWLQDSPLSIWVAESETIWAYPTILALHTMGLAILVGANMIVDFRLLGLGRAAPLAEMKKLFPLMWAGLVINTITGLLLFAAAARVKALIIMLWVKLGFVLLAVIALVRIRRLIFDTTARPEPVLPAGARRLAALSLFLWTGAIVAGRLMAYLEWEFSFFDEAVAYLE